MVEHDQQAFDAAHPGNDPSPATGSAADAPAGG
jgi:hypothetical protein